LASATDGVGRIGERFVTVPRHNEINELTARAILRDAKED